MLPTTLGKARKRSRSLLVTLVTLVVSCLLAGSVSVLVPQEASAATVSDNFNRANGPSGPTGRRLRDGGACDREQHPPGRDRQQAEQRLLECQHVR